MKVSDAMRLADEMGLPDLRGQFISWALPHWGGEKPPCCAIGGASVASRSFVFERQPNAPDMLTPRSLESAEKAQECDDWGRFISDHDARCPRCPKGRRHARSFLTMHLYDDHAWSRTQIADWLDSLDAEAQS